MKKIIQLAAILVLINCLSLTQIYAQTPAPLITTWSSNDSGASPNNQISVQVLGSGTIDWGDGTVTNTIGTNQFHTYASSGTYTVTFTGNFTYIDFSSEHGPKLRTVEQWGDISWNNMYAAFAGCNNLQVNANDAPDLSAVTNMERLFLNCSNLTGNTSFNSWDTSNVTNMTYLFSGTSFNQNISGWDVSNVTNMSRMFQNASSFNQNINNWDVSNVTSMPFMFSGATSFNQDISNWNVSNVTTMHYMFIGATSFNQDISNWDVSNVTSMGLMFLGATAFDQNLGNWDISSVNYITDMFQGATLSTANYDATLIGWATLSSGETQIPTNLYFDGGNSQYCAGETARQNLIDNYGWFITDGFKDPNCTPVTLIPDSNFEQALIDLGIDSGGAVNGQVLTSDISGVTTLDVSNKNISDLTGIEDFAALETLYCENNNLTSLDFSSNANLTSLECNDNNLTSLNISSNIALENLNCTFNSLTGLDVSSNTALLYLQCSSNNINSLDVSNNTLLENLVCNTNNLSSLDVSNNPALSFLGCNENNLSSLDLSNNTSLEILYCASNGIVELDLAANTVLNDFDCSNNNLANLDVQNGNNIGLTYFDATGNPGLVCIQVDDVAYSNANWSNKDAQTSFGLNCAGSQTYVPDDAFEQALIDLGYDVGPLNDYVPYININSVTSLDVISKGISDLTGIEGFASLETLYCNDNNLSSLDISNNTLLAYLICPNNSLTSLDISNNSNLNYLDFGSNGISNIDVSNNTLLTHLLCNDNNLSSLNVSNNTLLTYLQCYSNGITDLDLSALTSFTGLYCQNNALESLNLQNGNNVNIEHYNVTNNPNLICIQVDDVAYSNTSLTNKDAQTMYSIDCVSQTYVPDDNFEQALVDLGLDTLPLDDYVTTSLINSLTTIDLNSLGISDLTGIEDFAALEYLYCSFNNLSSLDVSLNANLISLYCDENSLTNIVLGNNTNLDELVCSDNSLTDLDLSSNTSLTILNCANNNLSSLNVKNGNNTNFTSFYATGNPSLSCIQVDDVTYSNANWTNKDAHTSYSISCGPQTYVPDDNFEQALINLGYDSGPLDDYVPTELISVVTDLDVSYGAISDLTGIEDFSALERLDCSNNSLTSLNLSGNPLLNYLHCYENGLSSLDTSNNPALEDLVCWSNDLNNLDLSNNLLLYFLSCSDNNLASLDVSNNSALEILYCALNNITNLDISNNPSVNDFDCSNNSLTSLNVQNGNNTNFSSFVANNNPSLNCVQVDDVAYSDANWTNIDPQTSFSEDCSAPITLIPDSNFEQALIDLGIDTDGVINGQVLTSDVSSITTLNVNSKNINDLTGIEDFIGLTELRCYDNNLTSLNVDNNVLLTLLQCYNNNLNALNVDNNVDLTELLVYSNNISSIDVTNNVGLVTLKVSGNNLNTLNIDNNIALVTLATGSNNLSSLNISNNTLLEVLGVGANNLSSLDVSSSTELRVFECDQNNLTSLNVDSNPNLVWLTCSSNNLTDLSIKSGNNITLNVFNSTNNSNLTCIDVDDAAYSTANWTGIDPQTSFSEDCNPPVTLIPDTNFEQTLINQGIDSDGIINGQVFTNDISSLTNLSVDQENINDLSGIEDFLALEVLDCSRNDLTSLDMSNNLALTNLDCESNSLASLNVITNASLIELNCFSNDLSSLDVSNNSALEHLSCGANNLTSLNVDNNAALTYLNCSSNSLTSLNIDNNTALTFLDCRSNNLGSLNVSNNIVLETLQSDNTGLNSIDVSNNAVLKYLYVGENNLASLDVTNNPLLEWLDCGTNNLTSLDLTNNTALVRVYSYFNSITSLDVSNSPNLFVFLCKNNNLESLNIKNGNNTNIGNFQANDNPNLTCIEVDDAAYSTSNWTSIDAQTSFSEDCNPSLTLIPDANFEQALIDLGIDSDGVINGQVFTSDISGVTSLDVSNKNISDLTGIEDFSALTNLNCNNNNLNALDISNNILLSIIQCNNNGLNNLDVSVLGDLLALDCSSNNLSNLNLSNNGLLNTLYCNDNNLSSLDVSSNSSLSTLLCSNNNIGVLDVSNHPSLFSLECFGNNLTSLDVSINNFLTSLDCSSNNLSSLNAQNGNNSNFTSFNATNNPSLTCIQVDDVAYSDVNWTNIDPQTSFSEDCNPQTYVPDDAFEQALIDLGYDSGALDDYVPTANISVVTSLSVFSEGISDLTGIEDFVALEELLCYANSLTNLDISTNTSLKVLHCGTNSLTSLDVSNNIVLEKLYCWNNNLTSLDVSNNTVLEELGFDDNNLTSLDINNNIALKVLRCTDNSLTNLDITNNIALQKLWCYGNSLTSLDISNNTDLTELLCYGNSLTSLNVDNAIALTELECYNNNLVSLDVSDCSALEELICYNNSLMNLDVSSNIALIKLQCYNNNLASLDLNNANALENLWCYNNSLTSLDVSSNTSLGQLWCNNNNLTSLDVSNNTILYFLNCTDNDLTGLDVSVNSALGSLSCDNNNLSSLNVQNGNNVNIDQFTAVNNPNLTCIQVDDVAYSDANWTNKDATASYSTNCNVVAGSNYLMVEDGNAFVGETNAINLLLENDETLKGFQFDITFPSGFVFDPLDIVNVGLPAGFQISASALGGNIYRVLGFSLANETISADSRVIISFPTLVEEGTADGDYPLPVTNVTLSDTNNTDIADPSPTNGVVTVFEHSMGDPNGDDSINILDILAVIDHIFGNTPSNFNDVLADVNEDGTINILDILEIQDIIFSSTRVSNINKEHNSIENSRRAGDNYLRITDLSTAPNSSTTIEIELHNDDVVKGMEFNFILPVGFTFNPADINATSRLSGFTVTAQEIGANTYKVLIFSLSASTVAVGTNSILNLPVSIEPDINTGTYPISFSNVIISDTNNTNVSTPAQSVGEVSINILGVDSLTSFDMMLYPNPILDKLYFKSDHHLDKLSVSIFDVLGKQVHFTKKLKTDFIDLSKLSSGVYIVKLRVGNAIATERIIKD